MNKREAYKINGYVTTDVGLLRQNNEDNFLFGNQLNEESSPHLEMSYTVGEKMQWNCFAVFDGIGGAERGELASKLASEAGKENAPILSVAKDYVQVDKIMKHIFLEANNKIVKARKEISVCGTTGTAFVTDGVVAKIFHVGDSRAYLYREHTLYRLTKDQTLAQLKVDAGLYQSILNASERELHQLTEYIGRDETMQYFRPTEGAWFDFRIGDQILLCSDGLYDLCSHSEICSVLEEKISIEEKVTKMTNIVLEKGAHDNITCILLEKQKDKIREE